MTSNTVVNQTGRPLRHITVKTTRPAESGRMRLKDLILTRKKDLGLTYAQMVRNAENAGRPISRSMLHHFTDPDRDLKNIPTTDSLLAIAAAIDVDPDEVLAAAAESIGITTRDLHLDRGARALLAMLEDRTPDQIAALEAVVRTVTRALDTGEPREQTDTDREPPAD